MDQQELNLIIANHKRWLLGEAGGERASLRYTDLSNTDLSGADLSYIDLSYADLSGADLSGTELRGANLYCANLSGANLSSANLYGANLSGTDLRGTVLRGTDLNSTNLKGASLSGTDLKGANLYHVFGNGREIKTIQTDIWQIVYTDTVMHIGCENHNIDSWFNFSDDKISDMHPDALEWWSKWKPILALILERDLNQEQ